MRRHEIGSSYDLWDGRDWVHHSSLQSLVASLEEENSLDLEDYIVVQRLHKGQEEIGVVEYDDLEDFVEGIKLGRA